MDLRQLGYFAAVAEELNFTRAAARSYVAQSALSYQIARLEREQGVALFERTSRSVRLTAAGELLLPYARRILAEVSAAEAELAGLSGLLTGRLRLGVVGSAAKAAPAVETVLAAFHRRHPAVEISLRDSGSRLMAEQVRDNALDLALVGLFAAQLPAGLGHLGLADEPLVAIVPPAHRLSGRESTSLAELAESDVFIELREESGLRVQVDAAFERAGVQRRTAFELATSDSVVRLVGLGLGVAVVPRSAADAVSPVVRLALHDAEARHPITLVHRDPAPTAPSARVFLAMLRQQLGSAATE